MSLRSTLLFAVVVLAAAAPTALAGGYPPDAVRRKEAILAVTAGNAVRQQRKTHFDPIPLEGRWSGAGGVKVEESTAWDVDGDGRCYRITVTDIRGDNRDKGVKDLIQVRFPGPVNFVEKSTGFGFWIKTDERLSRDLRFGVYFKGLARDPIVFTDIPVRHKFGDNPHQAYVDWGHVFDNSCGVFRTPPNSFWTAVTGFDLPVVHKRLPVKRGLRLGPASGTFYVDGLQLMDIYEGSYDSARFPEGRINAERRWITAQGRTQQVARICAGYGGDAGQKSAIRAMDMMVRMQCWDGSWPEMRTRLQGAYTHGMIVADLAYALRHLREAKRTELGGEVKIRHYHMEREKLYEQTLYRGAMSRAPGPVSQWKDSYISGQGSLESGCNRPMVFLVSQYVTAQVMTDPRKKKTLMDEYSRNMDELVRYQGITAGGWPIFGEGNRYRGKGLHWDVSYTIDHVFIMSFASRVTGDERWGRMMKKFDTVVKAMVLADGFHIDGALSERGRGRRDKIKVPDIVFQEAVRWEAPYFAQWAANSSRALWRDFPQGLWAYARSARGYGLGAFITWNCYDLQQDPAPRDLGVYFPRQWPVWSARWVDKNTKKVVRKALATVSPDGKVSIPFKWEVGQYPVATGMPVAVVPAGGSVEIEVLEYTGRASNLPAEPRGRVSVQPGGAGAALRDGAFTVDVGAKATIAVDAGRVKVKFTAEPKGAEKVTLKCRLLRKPR